MEIKGKITEMLPMQTGEGKSGQWRKQEIIVETNARFPKKVCIAIWNDKIDESNLSLGEDITAKIDIESREFNGKWYTNVQAWKIEKSGEHSNSDSQEHFSSGNDSVESTSSEEMDDLPF